MFVKRRGSGNSLCRKVKDDDGVWRTETLVYLGHGENLDDAYRLFNDEVNREKAVLARLDADYLIPEKRRSMDLDREIYRAERRLESVLQRRDAVEAVQFELEPWE